MPSAPRSPPPSRTATPPGTGSSTPRHSAGESLWPLPIPPELLEKLKQHSKVADLANIIGEAWGGALTAAAFLGEFVADGIDWAHLDIAGPAFNDGGASNYTPAGGTGFAVRTLVQLASSSTH